MNIFKRLFKRQKPFIQEDWSNAKKEMEKAFIEKFDAKKGFAPGAIIHFNNLLPRLTPQEVILLGIIVKLYPFKMHRPDINNMYGKDPSKALLSLVNKGYIERSKKGWYKLTFAKYD